MTTQAPLSSQNEIISLLIPKSFTLDLTPGIEFSANVETELTTAAKTHLSTIINWILPNKGLFAETLSKIFQGTSPSSAIDSQRLVQTLKSLRGEVKTNNLQLTCYKYLFSACLHSDRHPKELLNFCKSFKEAFSIDGWESTIVQDALLAQLPAFGEVPWQLMQTQKVKIVALSCLLLRLDGMTQVSETEMLRAVTTTLRSGAIAPAELMAEMGKSPSMISKELSLQGRQWGLLFLARMGCADGVLRPKEQEFIQQVLTGESTLTAAVKDLIERIIWIETGITLQL